MMKETVLDGEYEPSSGRKSLWVVPGIMLRMVLGSVLVGLKNGDVKVASLDTSCPARMTPSGCVGLNMKLFEKGRLCGAPLSAPCFDYNRCMPPPGGSGHTIYVYDDICSLKNSSDMAITEPVPEEEERNFVWRAAAREAGVLAETYASACMFLFVQRMHRAPCAVDAPLWNEGVNHIVVDHTDASRADHAEVANSYAMEVASNTRACYYRTGFDISIPLYPKHLFPDIARTPATERAFFLTAKGSVYLTSHGSEERNSIVPLDDPASGIVTSMHCKEKATFPCPGDEGYCARLEARYGKYSYAELLNSTFALVPAGRSPATYRLAEVMSAGAIPVFVGRSLVPPFREQYDWESFSFMFTPDEVESVMLKVLRSVPPSKLLDMQRLAIEARRKMIGDVVNGFEKIAGDVIDEIIRRIQM